MKHLSDRAKAARKHAGYNQSEAARRIGVSREAISQWESGKTKSINSERLHKAARTYGVSAEWLASGKGSMEDNVNNVSPAIQQPATVPLISWVQAGSFSEAIDLHQAGIAEDYVARINGGEKVYALMVRGDSMTAPVGSPVSFPEGYIIHVDPDKSANSGDFVIAKINGQDAVTFKQLKYGDSPYLQPLNPDHKPIFEEFRILGKVIGVSLKL